MVVVVTDIVVVVIDVVVVVTDVVDGLKVLIDSAQNKLQKYFTYNPDTRKEASTSCHFLSIYPLSHVCDKNFPLHLVSTVRLII